MHDSIATLPKMDMERIKIAVEVIPQATVVINKEGRIINMNARALHTFGYTPEEIIGEHIEILVPERYRGNHVHHRMGYFKAPEAKDMGAGRDLAGLRKDGTEFPVEIGLQAFETEQGVVAMGTVIDISERRKLEELVQRQRADLMELSTPVIRLWQDILVLPIVGTLDSERSRVMVEQLLHALSDSDYAIAILDISGVPTVDTLVAQHIMKAIDATRLMGSECIISGVRPEIANTIVNLGLDLSGVKTKSTMAKALLDAFTTLKLKVVSME